MAGWFKAGSFMFPTSLSPLSITGLPGQPTGCIFFGSNQATEDTLLHGPAIVPGVFFGMAWRTLAGGIDFQSQSNAGRVTPASYGVRWRARPITMIVSGTTLEYEASSIAFNANGFTLTIATAAPGPRPIHYLVWGGFDEARGSHANKGVATNHDFLLAARAYCGLAFSMFASGNNRNSQNGSACYFTMGTGNFPEVPFSGPGAGDLNYATAITMRAQTQTAEGWTQRYFNGPFNNTIMAAVSSGLVGTWQTQYDHLRPVPTMTDLTLRLSLFGSPSVASLAWWSTEGAALSIQSPGSVGGVSDYAAPARVPGVDAALFFGTTGYGSESQLGVNCAYIYGVLTDDYQGVVAWDTGRGGAPADGQSHFFQSRQMCYAECLRNGGLRAASGELIGNTVRLTGVHAATAAPGKNGNLQVWGVGREAPWLPSYFRVPQPH
jgi:hypothetical protein